MFNIGDRIICIKSKYGNIGKIAEVIGLPAVGEIKFTDTKGNTVTFHRSGESSIIKMLGSPLTVYYADGTYWGEFPVAPTFTDKNWCKLEDVKDEELDLIEEEVK